jgi:hypothetical protein
MQSYSAEEYERACRILGVPTDASVDEIKAAYLNKIRVAHPDAGGDEEAAKELEWARVVALDEPACKAYEEANSSIPIPVFYPSLVDFGELRPGDPPKRATVVLRNEGGPVRTGDRFEMHPQNGSFWVLADYPKVAGEDVICGFIFEVDIGSDPTPAIYNDTVHWYVFGSPVSRFAFVLVGTVLLVGNHTISEYLRSLLPGKRTCRTQADRQDSCRASRPQRRI